MGERGVRNAEAVGSIPIISTRLNRQVQQWACFFIPVRYADPLVRYARRMQVAVMRAQWVPRSSKTSMV